MEDVPLGLASPQSVWGDPSRGLKRSGPLTVQSFCRLLPPSSKGKGSGRYVVDPDNQLFEDEAHGVRADAVRVYMRVPRPDGRNSMEDMSNSDNHSHKHNDHNNDDNNDSGVNDSTNADGGDSDGGDSSEETKSSTPLAVPPSHHTQQVKLPGQDAPLPPLTLPERKHAWQSFAFHEVWAPEALKESVFVDSTASLVRDVVRGRSVAVIAHGPSSSGKQAVLWGTGDRQGVNAGLAPRLVDSLIQTLSETVDLQHTADCRLAVSVCGLYGQLVRDLVAGRDARKHEVTDEVVLTEEYIAGAVHLTGILSSALNMLENWSVGELHSCVEVVNVVLRLRLVQKMQDGTTVQGSAYVVQLADAPGEADNGSSADKKAHTSVTLTQRQIEDARVRHTLEALQRCMQNRLDSRAHRDDSQLCEGSVLTLMLRRALGFRAQESGDGKSRDSRSSQGLFGRVAMFACVTTDVEQRASVLQSLQYSAACTTPPATRPSTKSPQLMSWGVGPDLLGEVDSLPNLGHDESGWGSGSGGHSSAHLLHGAIAGGDMGARAELIAMRRELNKSRATSNRLRVQLQELRGSFDAREAQIRLEERERFALEKRDIARRQETVVAKRVALKMASAVRLHRDSVRSLRQVIGKMMQVADAKVAAVHFEAAGYCEDLSRVTQELERLKAEGAGGTNGTGTVQDLADAKNADAEGDIKHGDGSDGNDSDGSDGSDSDGSDGNGSDDGSGSGGSGDGSDSNADSDSDDSDNEKPKDVWQRRSVALQREARQWSATQSLLAQSAEISAQLAKERDRFMAAVEPMSAVQRDVVAAIAHMFGTHLRVHGQHLLEQRKASEKSAGGGADRGSGSAEIPGWSTLLSLCALTQDDRPAAKLKSSQGASDPRKPRAVWLVARTAVDLVESLFQEVQSYRLVTRRMTTQLDGCRRALKRLVTREQKRQLALEEAVINAQVAVREWKREQSWRRRVQRAHAGCGRGGSVTRDGGGSEVEGESKSGSEPAMFIRNAPDTSGPGRAAGSEPAGSVVEEDARDPAVVMDSLSALRHAHRQTTDRLSAENRRLKARLAELSVRYKRSYVAQVGTSGGGGGGGSSILTTPLQRPLLAAANPDSGLGAIVFHSPESETGKGLAQGSSAGGIRTTTPRVTRLLSPEQHATPHTSPPKLVDAEQKSAMTPALRGSGGGVSGDPSVRVVTSKHFVYKSSGNQQRKPWCIQTDNAHVMASVLQQTGVLPTDPITDSTATTPVRRFRSSQHIQIARTPVSPASTGGGGVRSSASVPTSAQTSSSRGSKRLLLGSTGGTASTGGAQPAGVYALPGSAARSQSSPTKRYGGGSALNVHAERSSHEVMSLIRAMNGQATTNSQQDQKSRLQNIFSR